MRNQRAKITFRSKYIAEILIIMDILYFSLLSQTCFYRATCWRTQPICSRVAPPVHNAQGSRDYDGRSIYSDNSDFCRNIPSATVS